MKRSVPLKLEDSIIEDVEELQREKSLELCIELSRNDALTMLIKKGFQMLRQEGYKK